ncbi:hypothetical protein SCLCIDRAFT_919626 [Scleroderma citrinum Foug A]|uniref:Uncharacterized protein n=1 Tax=Scleroderma citrinum Foug A TaxID=1036808 RepID=A0A0C3DJY2_9AGAM|nr:hypothetical protein SCLCIDRAFT_919626 [Scleroderma citrinum Foug A]
MVYSMRTDITLQPRVSTAPPDILHNTMEVGVVVSEFQIGCHRGFAIALVYPLHDAPVTWMDASSESTTLKYTFTNGKAAGCTSQDESGVTCWP